MDELSEQRWAETERQWQHTVENFDLNNDDHIVTLLLGRLQAKVNEAAWANGWPRALTGLASLSVADVDEIMETVMGVGQGYQPTLPFEPMYPEPRVTP